MRSSKMVDVRGPSDGDEAKRAMARHLYFVRGSHPPFRKGTG